RQAPVFGRFRQPAIDVGGVRGDTIVQAEAKRLKGRVAQPIVDKALDGGALHAGIVIPLEEQLQGHFTSTRASGHNGILSQVPLLPWYRIARVLPTAEKGTQLFFACSLHGVVVFWSHAALCSSGSGWLGVPRAQPRRGPCAAIPEGWRLRGL